MVLKFSPLPDSIPKASSRKLDFHTFTWEFPHKYLILLAISSCYILHALFSSCTDGFGRSCLAVVLLAMLLDGDLPPMVAMEIVQRARGPAAIQTIKVRSTGVGAVLPCIPSMAHSTSHCQRLLFGISRHVYYIL